MTLKLSNGEQASIDLILDRATAADRSTMPFSSSVGSSNASATNAVQQLLGLLATMPVEEPASDLVTRTMSFIDRSVATVHPTAINSTTGSSQSLPTSVLSALAAHPQQ